jgi:hypothetical protein
MEALFGSSRQEPKPGAEAAAGDVDDEPASEYRRLERFVVAWLVGDNTIFTLAALSKGKLRWNAMAMEIMVFAISMSLCLLLAFGTLQSLRVGPRAIAIWFLFWLGQAVISILFTVSEGGTIGETIGGFVWHAFVAATFAWFIKVIRSELRALGSLDTVTRITGRLTEIIGLQAALSLIGVSQGIGEDDIERLVATHIFQLSLSMAWLFSLGIYDVGGVDPHLAVTKMKLSLVESAALFFTGMLVLSGLGAYFLSERSRPDRRAVLRLFFIFSISILGAYCCTARVVWVARRRRRSKVSDSDREDPETPA